MPTPTENAVALTGTKGIDGLLQGSRWDFGSGPRVLTYSFSINDTSNGGAWSARADMMSQVRVALDAWASVANISFTEVGSGGVFLPSTADMAITLTGNRMLNAFGAVGLAVFPSPSFAGTFRQDTGYDATQYPKPEGDVFFDNYYPDYNDVSTGRIGFYYLLHETGHALGLKHPSDDGFNSRPTFAQLGISALDATNFTIMSNNLSQGKSNPTSLNPQTPMILDILAMQQLYGANMSYHTGDDAYTVGQLTRTIWDAGGFDVLDASASAQAVDMDLSPGSISNVVGTLAYTAVAFNVTIEKAIGSGLNDTIKGSISSDIIDGGPGADSMEGRAGDDQYWVDNAADVIVEQSGEGTDTIMAGVTYTLPGNVENLTLTGSSVINGTGNSVNNILTGNSAVNVLSGGAGDDVYVVQNSGDTVVELSGQGADRVESSVTYTLSTEVEDLTLTGAGNIDGTGNASSNVIRGNGGNNVLDGAAGNDSMFGGGGSDTFIVDSAQDQVSESPGEGLDTVMSSVTYTVTDPDVENLTLTGAGAINGTGNSVNNTLTGNSADNLLTGGAGDDVYVVQNAGDTVVEQTGEGTDRLESSISFALPSNVEDITLTGTGDVNATGNTLGNRLVGNSGINALTGGDGDDVYVVQNAGDVVVEAAAQGRDRIESALTTTLPGNVEDLTLTGTSDVNGTGNVSNNVLLGNAGINVLTGGQGDDTYGVDNAADVVIENAGEGTDTVMASISYTLGSTLENLTLTGTGNLNGMGTASSNTFTGNRGDNLLTSGGGSDTFIGGVGVDTAVLSGLKSAYTMTYAGGRITLTSATTTEVLTGVESVQYGDGSIQAVATLYLEAGRDADGDGKADIYWRNTDDGRVSAWLMNGLTVKQGEVFSNVPLEWQVQDTLDLDGDGKSDLLWRNVNDGRVSTWLMDGLTVKQGEVFGNVPLEWKVQGTADFDGDGHGDILWRNVNDGRVSAWLMNGLTVVQGEVFSNVPLEWQIQKTGDFNGDGSGDILWRNVNDGRVSAWLMNGLTVKEGTVFSDVPLDWKVQETGDLDADGHTDILWRHVNSGQVSAWLMDGLQVKQGTVFSDVPLEWQVRGMGDFNNDLHADILWRHTDGSVSQWLMNGLSVLEGSVFSQVPTNWVIV